MVPVFNPGIFWKGGAENFPSIHPKKTYRSPSGSGGLLLRGGRNSERPTFNGTEEGEGAEREGKGIPAKVKVSRINTEWCYPNGRKKRLCHVTELPNLCYLVIYR